MPPRRIPRPWQCPKALPPDQVQRHRVKRPPLVTPAATWRAMRQETRVAPTYVAPPLTGRQPRSAGPPSVPGMCALAGAATPSARVEATAAIAVARLGRVTGDLLLSRGTRIPVAALRREHRRSRPSRHHSPRQRRQGPAARTRGFRSVQLLRSRIDPAGAALTAAADEDAGKHENNKASRAAVHGADAIGSLPHYGCVGSGDDRDRPMRAIGYRA